MTRHWKLSQIISISFVSLILIAAIVGIVSAEHRLMSDDAVPIAGAPQAAL